MLWQHQVEKKINSLTNKNVVETFTTCVNLKRNSAQLNKNVPTLFSLCCCAVRKQWSDKALKIFFVKIQFKEKTKNCWRVMWDWGWLCCIIHILTFAGGRKPKLSRQEGGRERGRKSVCVCVLHKVGNIHSSTTSGLANNVKYSPRLATGFLCCLTVSSD